MNSNRSRSIPASMKAFACLATILCTAVPALAADELVSFNGQFGNFISLGATVDQVQALAPDRVEPAVTEDERISSHWYYYSGRGVRVRVCADNNQVETVNAGVSMATRKYVTEAGVRIGDELGQVIEAYGDRLQVMPETEGTIRFVDSERNNNRITFGFSENGQMRWVALGALRENGWTCGVEPNE